MGVVIEICINTPGVQLESKGLTCRTCTVPYCKHTCVLPASISVAFIQVGPPGYFIYISITTPVVSALKNYYI
jgi:hypothetical protein